ncbi:MAG: 4Fe-4S dicluster domain-containing protein [Lachnospiraceae bacterium]|nr:4Fe-4S dicluster domain-containing protein [Lachnospiraceae bacterium]
MPSLKDYIERDYGIRRTPLYIAERCTERKATAHVCQTCAEICPQNIYPTGKRKRPMWDQCLKCGLCAAACPARCITVPSRKAESFLMAVARKGKLTVACEKEDSAARLNERCVAALSWEQLAYAALREGVVISLRACGECGDEACKEIIDRNLKELKFFLGEEVYRERVTVLREGDTYEVSTYEEAISRRDLFGFLGNLSVDKAFTMMPKMVSARDSGLFFRAMLRDMVAQNAEGSEPAQRPRYAVRLPHFTKKCYNCGHCEQACPNEALKLVKGRDGFTVKVDVWKCTGCGLCKNKCRAGGIDGIVPMRVSTLGAVAVAKLPDHICSICGRVYAYDTELDHCKTCEAKLHAAEMKREREERRKRKAQQEADEALEAKIAAGATET